MCRHGDIAVTWAAAILHHSHRTDTFLGHALDMTPMETLLVVALCYALLLVAHKVA